MVPEWEMATGVDFGMGMEFGSGARYSTTAPVVAPLTPTTSATATTPAYLYGALPPTADASLRVDDLLDFSNHDLYASVGVDAQFYATTTTVPGSGPPSGQTFSGRQSQHTTFDLYIPQCEDAAELEWLSKFVEDSFSDVPSYQSGAAVIAPSCEAQLRAEQSANGRGARGKRSRATIGAVSAAAWSSLVTPPHPPAQNSPSSSSSSSSSEFSPSRPKAGGADNGNRGSRGKKGGGGVGLEGGVRRCTHCASEKTPQWRTGPLGPKTLCNACGVRFKSGRLVPEYRPAASPTFVLTQHSNSHRKVMELRRQKELLLLRHQENDPSSGRPDLLFSDYGVC
ncbi:GATA transcription factor 4 isoform X2 [Musa acuminata AAA Group]|uniref:GATA transcription factor 4 isoform X2 n=1 Tax=Musa acuminata AAA Group TaxID=214697 RepID=UPI0031E33568